MIGKTIGRYRIVTLLGKGTMGSVWKAEDTLLGRPVALKLLNESEAQSEEARRRFLREARSASRLDHSGIATVFDAGESDGQIYLAFLYVDGETLAEKISRGPLSSSEAVRLCRSAAAALSYAHEQGVLHRNITSRNLMVTSDGRLFVVDFGLAQPEDQTRITRTGTVMGTVATLAPEIIGGGAATARSEVYSLGTVLYEMLTGRTPFQAERSEAMMYRIVNEEPEPPSRRAAGISPALDEIVLKAIAPDPEKRYATMAEMEVALAHIEAEEGRRIPSGVKGAQRRLPGRRRPGRRAPRSLVLVILLAVIAASGVAALRLFRIGPFQGDRGRITSIAVLPLQNTSHNPEDTDFLARGIGDAVAGRLNELSDLRVVPWITSQRFADLSNLQETARTLNVDALIVGTIQISGDQIRTSLALVGRGGRFQEWTGNFVEPMGDIFAVERNIALKVAEQIRGTLTSSENKALTQAPAESREAYKLYRQGSYELHSPGEAATNRALDLFERAVMIDPTLAEAWLGIGAVHSSRYFFGWEGGESNLDTAQRAFETALALKPGLVQARRGIAAVAFEQGGSEQALKAGQDLPVGKADDIDNTMVRAQAYLQGGFPDKAVPLLRKVLEIEPLNEGAQWWLAVSSCQAGLFTTAEEAGQEYLDRFGPEPEVQCWLALAQQSLGHADLAMENYEQALEGFDSDSNVYVNFMAGNFYARIGRKNEAREVVERGLRQTSRSLTNWPDNNRMQCLETALYGLLGDTLRLETSYSRCREQWNRRGHVHPAAAYVAAAMIRNGRPDRAAEILVRLKENGNFYRSMFESVMSEEDLALPEIVSVLTEPSPVERRLRETY